MSSRYNIFKDFHETKKIIVENRQGDYTELNVKLICLVEKYLQSCVWANSEVEKTIWTRSGSGASLATIATNLGVIPSTLRSNMHRINKRLTSTLFEGERLSTVCLSTDSNVIKQYISSIELLISNFDIFNELSSSVIHEINNTGFSDETEFTEGELFNALAFLAMHSKSVIDFQLSKLNINAVEKALEVLSGGRATDELSWYQALVGNYKKPFNMKPETIEKIKIGK